MPGDNDDRCGIVGKPIEIIQTRYTRSVSLGSLRCAAGFMVSDCSFSLPALDRQIKTAMLNDEALKAAAYLLLVVHGAAVGAEAAASRRYAAKRDEA